MSRVLVLVFTSLIVTGCITRGQIDASAWLNNGLPAELCQSDPRLMDYGFYRKLNTGHFEFIPFCDPLALHMTAFHDQDLEKILDGLLGHQH